MISSPQEQQDEPKPPISTTHSKQQRIYDYILVGAGPSAMGLLHGFLTKTKTTHDEHLNYDLTSSSILVIEAGSSSSHTDTDKINSWFRAAHSQRKATRNATNKVGTALLSSAPQSGLSNRIIDIPCGSGLGGGSNINAGLVVRPDFDNDFQSWPDRWRDGNIIKGACDVVEDAMRRNGGVENWSCCNQFLNLIGKTQTTPAVDEVVMDSTQQLRFQSTPSFASSNGYRVNYYESLVQPLLRREEAKRTITFMKDTRVTRVLWSCNNEEEHNDGQRKLLRRTSGVMCTDANNHTFSVQASKEVILCAGAIHTPVLLLQSGIGDLDKLPKSVVEACSDMHHLPAVGKNLCDHLIIPRIFLTLPQWHVRQSWNAVQAWYRTTSRQNNNDGATMAPKAKIPVFQMIISDGAVMAHVGPSCIAAPFRRVSRFFELLFLCIYHLVRILLDCTPLHHVATKMVAVLIICLMNPASTGSISLREVKGEMNDNWFTVVIDPGYLAEKVDIELIQQIWQRSDEIARRHYSNSIEVLPGPFYRLLFRSYLTVFVRHFAQPYFHWMGTCAIGGKEQGCSVVNENLQVSGIRGLRICDASVFAGPISSPTALTCAALGYAASSFVFEDCNRRATPT